MGAVCCRRRRVDFAMFDAPDMPTLQREVCNHKRYVAMDSVFYFAVDPRLMKRVFLYPDDAYMTHSKFDTWLVLYYLKKKQKVEKGVLKPVLPDSLIKTIAQYM